MKNLLAFLIILLLFLIACNQRDEKHDYFIDSRDGQKYRTVKIGNQWWMAENLNYITTHGSWCYLDKDSNCNKYGRLYNWQTAMKVCPTGWHLPTKAEFDTLLKNCGGAGENAYKQLIIGGPSGFNSLKGGLRSGSYIDSLNNNIYFNIDIIAYYWSATESFTDNSWVLDIGKWENVARVYDNYMNVHGLSVRCVKDQ
jgi:uncharacterized protein (TIGR02145 family)